MNGQFTGRMVVGSIDSARGASVGLGDVNQRTVVFPGIRMQDVSKIDVQYQQIRYAVFNNLPVKPRTASS
jgi:hypothetical protein